MALPARAKRIPNTPLPPGTDGLRANRSTREGNLATGGVGPHGPTRVETARLRRRRCHNPAPEHDKPTDTTLQNKLPEWKREFPKWKNAHSKARQIAVRRIYLLQRESPALPVRGECSDTSRNREPNRVGVNRVQFHSACRGFMPAGVVHERSNSGKVEVNWRSSGIKNASLPESDSAVRRSQVDGTARTGQADTQAHHSHTGLTACVQAGVPVRGILPPLVSARRLKWKNPHEYRSVTYDQSSFDVDIDILPALKREDSNAGQRAGPMSPLATSRLLNGVQRGDTGFVRAVGLEETVKNT